MKAKKPSRLVIDLRHLRKPMPHPTKIEDGRRPTEDEGRVVPELLELLRRAPPWERSYARENADNDGEY